MVPGNPWGAEEVPGALRAPHGMHHRATGRSPGTSKTYVFLKEFNGFSLKIKGRRLPETPNSSKSGNISSNFLLKSPGISRESRLGLARAVSGSLGASSAVSGRAWLARKSPGAEKVKKIGFLEVFEATPDLYGLELPDSKNSKDFRGFN